MDTIKLKMLLSLAAVFLACVSNAQGFRRNDCMMRRMNGRPCNHSPNYIQRPTFIQMKFSGEDNDEYDDHGHDASHFSMNDFNKIRLRFEDDISRRFDNLERMIELLGQQFSTSSDKMCSCNLKDELRAMKSEIIHHCNSSNQGIDTTKSQMTAIAATTITIPSTVSLSTPTPSITTTITTEPPTTTTAATTTTATTTAFPEVSTNNVTPNSSNVHEFGKSGTTLATIEITTPVVDNETIHSTPPVETSAVVTVSENIDMMTPHNNIMFEDSAADDAATNLHLTSENIILMVSTPVVNYTIEEIPDFTETVYRNDTLADIDEGIQKNDTVVEVQSDSLLPEHVDSTSSSVEVSRNDFITVENENTGTTVRSLENSTGLVTEKIATEVTTEEDSGVWVYVKKPAGKLNDSEYWKIEDVVTLPPPKYRNMHTNVRTPKSRTRKGQRHQNRNPNRHRESQAKQLRLVNAKIAGPIL